MSGNGLRTYLRMLLTCWVAEDPKPAASWLDSKDGVR